MIGMILDSTSQIRQEPLSVVSQSFKHSQSPRENGLE